MIVMPADSCNRLVYLWQGRYGNLGWLFNAYTPRQKPWSEMPFAIDNGAFPCFTNRKPWDATRFIAGLDKIATGCVEQRTDPSWLLVPDVVCDREATIASWHEWLPRLTGYGWPLAFAVQDGMDIGDVPREAQVVFVGGSTPWKRATMARWCQSFPRVHVGRINTYRWLRVCEKLGAESCDGTGWFHGDNDQLEGLRKWLAEKSGKEPRDGQQSLSFDGTDDEMVPGSKSCETAALAPVGDAR